MRNLQLFFGSFSLCVRGKSNLINPLADDWEVFRQSQYPSQKTIGLRLEEAPFLGDLPPLDGWCVQDHDGHRDVRFGHHSKPYFALEFGADSQEITIRARSAFSNHVKLGLHYGLLVALISQCIGMHGVTLTVGNETVILSAPSGTGKTTLAKLLEQYHEAKIINGDFALISINDDGVFFEPTPYCGSSGICVNRRVQVDRIIFLGQSKENRWQSLDFRSSLQKCLCNTFVPTWDGELQGAVQANVIKLLSHVKVNSFSFAPEKEAADLVFNQLSREEASSPIE